MSYKTIDGLMRHLRSSNISIKGSKQKTQLVNVGYFHGYKGYRFFQVSTKRIPFSSFEEIYATIQYDSRLKALFYDKMMFIETAMKNIALESILQGANSESIPLVFEKVVCGYNNSPTASTEEEKKKCQQMKLNLQHTIQTNLARAYNDNNPKITHFYNNQIYGEVPIWALFEIMTMGDFGFLLSCLTFDQRRAISQRLGLNTASDTNLELIYKYIYSLKDLRNAIAHNAVVFDARFRKFDPTRAMKSCLINEIRLAYVNFKTIGDYVILMCYYLKLLKVTKTELKAFVREFERITAEYNKSVAPQVSAIVIRPDLTARMATLKNYI